MVLSCSPQGCGIPLRQEHVRRPSQRASLLETFEATPSQPQLNGLAWPIEAGLALVTLMK